MKGGSWVWESADLLPPLFFPPARTHNPLLWETIPRRHCFSEVRDIPPLRTISLIVPVNSKQTATGDLDSFRITPAPQLLHISPSLPSSHPLTSLLPPSTSLPASEQRQGEGERPGRVKATPLTSHMDFVQ